MSPLVHILVLNWKAAGHTIRCVESLLELDYPNFQIVLLDNASPDGSEAVLRARFPELTLLQTGANLGYAGGNNRGIAYALQHGARYIWLLNNDTRVAPDSLSTLVQALEDEPRAAMAGSKIYFMDRPDHISYAGGSLGALRCSPYHRGARELDKGQYDDPAPVDFVTGCSLLVRGPLVERLGPLREDYFLYCEDVEWCLRFKNAGYQLLYAPDSNIWHIEGGSTGGEANPNTIYYCIRNRLYLFEHTLPPLRRVTGTVYLAYFHLKTILKLGIDRSDYLPGYSRAVFQAFTDYLGGRTGPRPSADDRT